jgi:Uma2 family endonuclease
VVKAEIVDGELIVTPRPEGVTHLWLVDPLATTLDVHRLEGGRWVVTGAHGGDDTIRVEPFEAIEVRLGRWWLDAR